MQQPTLSAAVNLDPDWKKMFDRCCVCASSPSVMVMHQSVQACQSTKGLCRCKGPDSINATVTYAMVGASKYEQISADHMLHSAGLQVQRLNRLDSLLYRKLTTGNCHSVAGPGTMSMHVVVGMPAALLQPHAGMYTRLYVPNACGSLFPEKQPKT